MQMMEMWEHDRERSTDVQVRPEGVFESPFLKLVSDA